MISKSILLTQLDRAIQLHDQLIPLLDRNIASSSVFSAAPAEDRAKTIEAIEKLAEVFKTHQSSLRTVVEEVNKKSTEVF